MTQSEQKIQINWSRWSCSIFLPLIDRDEWEINDDELRAQLTNIQTQDLGWYESHKQIRERGSERKTSHTDIREKSLGHSLQIQ